MGDAKTELTLEEMLVLLDGHVKKLESEDISLEESFHTYEEGMKLIKECNSWIDRVEKKVMQLDDDGSLQDMN